MNGATYLQTYSAVVLGAVLLALGLRRWAGTGGQAPAEQLSGVEYAYLAGGPRLALYASVADLRVSGSVQAFRRSGLIVGGPLVSQGELARAVHGALARDVPGRRLRRDDAVQATLERLRSGLDTRGLLRSAVDRALLRAGAALVLAVGLFGLLGVGRPAGTPGVVTVVALVALAAGMVLLLPTWASPRGRRSRAAARRANRKLAPPNAEVWSQHGPSGGALAVGLFGPGAIWAADPVFASQAGFYLRQRMRTPGRREVYDPSGAWAQLAYEDRTAHSRHLDDRIYQTRGGEVAFATTEVGTPPVTTTENLPLDGHTLAASYSDPSHSGPGGPGTTMEPFHRDPGEYGPADLPPAIP
jgi:uncharacterized protein (TIGR04222 family)